MSRIRSCCLLFLVLASKPVPAHHSYADFDRDNPGTISGTVTAVHWGNPHIIFILQEAAGPMRIEWITTAGAEVTGVAKDQIGIGDVMIVSGSRHLDPENRTMTLVQELHIPASNWQWFHPSMKGKRK